MNKKEEECLSRDGGGKKEKRRKDEEQISGGPIDMSWRSRREKEREEAGRNGIDARFPYAGACPV